MISLLRNTLLQRNLFFKPSFFFAQKSNVEFHKAVISSNIIQTIRWSPLNEYRSQSYPSLKEKILEYINEYEAKNSDGPDAALVKKAAEEVRNFFVDGVWVPSDMCNQNRFLEVA